MEKVDQGAKIEIMINTDMQFIDDTEGVQDKIIEAKTLIENSKELVDEVDFAVKECQLGVSKAADDFDIQKRIFLSKIFKNSEELLKKIGREYGLNGKIHEPFELSVDTHAQNIEIEHISSGRFTGLIFAIIFALATFFIWIYFSFKQLNLPFEKSSLSLNFLEIHTDMVLTWIGGGIIGLKGEPMLGGLILGFSVLIVAWIIYAIRVHFKTYKNLRLAKKAYIESQAYSFSKDECKREMLRVDAHLRDAIISIEHFTIMLSEENAILKRVIYVEGSRNRDDQEYHPSSKKVIRETEKLMKSIEALLNTSITKDGKLNPQSEKVLAVAKAVYADFIARIYD